MQKIHGNLDTLENGEQVDNKDVIERFFGLADFLLCLAHDASVTFFCQTVTKLGYIIA